MGGEARLGEGGGGAGGLGRQGGSVGLFLRFCCSLWTAGRHRHRVGQISGMFQNSYQCRFASCFCLWPVEPILLVHPPPPFVYACAYGELESLHFYFSTFLWIITHRQVKWIRMIPMMISA